MRKHVYLKHKGCELQYCSICDGGLLYCTVCNQAEGELEPECPGPSDSVAQPLHRSYIKSEVARCSTCDGGMCPDCTDVS